MLLARSWTSGITRIPVSVVALIHLEIAHTPACEQGDSNNPSELDKLHIVCTHDVRTVGVLH